MELLKKSITKSTINRMKRKGNYHKRYVNVINVVSDLLIQFYTMDREVEKEILDEIMGNIKKDIVEYIEQLKLDQTDMEKVYKENESKLKLFVKE